MKKRSIGLVCTIAFLLAVLLAGCASAQVCIDWAGTNVPGKMACSYSSFTGVETARFKLEEGQPLRVNFDVIVDHGALTLRLAAPDGENLWEKRFESGENSWFEVSHLETGRCTLEVEGEDTAGSFEVTWQLPPAPTSEKSIQRIKQGSACCIAVFAAFNAPAW